MKILLSIACVLLCTAPGPSQHMLEARSKTALRSFLPGESEYAETYHLNFGHLTVKAMEVTGFDEQSQQKLNLAFQVLESVVNSEEFRERVVNHMNTKGERSFASNKGLTNEEIYATFMEGREVLQPDSPGEMNFYLNLYNRWWSRVVGHTSAKTNVISVNYKYFKDYGPSEVAGNLAHEWVHKLGFDHRSSKEHDSAPYAIGYIVEDLGRQFLQRRELP